ncbi:MAG: type IX secretion system sortase PorU, partial [Bacteroidales bacterium]|nr:type IX secretion system sortase PorU [Bacteroidales bacterium]
FYEGTEILKELQVQSVNMFNYTGTYAQITDSAGSVYPLSSAPVFEIKFYNNGDSGAKGWLDFITLHGRKQNIFTGGTNFLSDAGSIAPARTTEFTVKSPAESPVIWDITDFSDPKIISYTKIGEDIRFKAPTETLRSFVLFLEKNTIEPLFRSEPVQNQDLHAAGPAEMAIITHPMFIKYAEKLADIHYKNSGLISQVVTIEEIYNEFSGGIPDIVAIRNFARMKYLRQSGTQQPFKYLLLFGDGSYENKTLPPGNPNFIPTYQSENSNVVVSSFTSDDFYGLLEEGEGEAEGTEDIGIGRLPVSDTSQAGIIIRKIASYIDPFNTGDWKNMICITADDEDGNTHMYDAEELSKILQNDVPAFRINKIYLDAFRQVTSINGQSYPEVTTAINDQMNSGALIFNYVGHGNENGLAHERVVTTENINSWKNGSRLPLFITATCEFSRFDDIDINILTGNMTGRTSAGEMVLLNEAGGGIALMTTTRVVYSAPNFFLNRNIYDFAFDVDADGNPLRLGDIMRLAKNNSGSGTNKRNFSLLGDPAVRLAFPRHGRVITDSINQVAVTNGTDSLKALARITVSGHIEDPGGSIINDYNGLVSPVVFDKPANIKTLANDGGQIFNFEMRNNILFNGKTAATDGRFRFTFIVPRDIDYSYGEGKINYYTFEEGLDMNGSFSEIIVGGFAEAISDDTKGPDIKLYLNDTLFRDGGITDHNPKLLAIIQDENGINTTGAGIGHDIIAYLDKDPNTSIVLNNYFENDFDNYMKGKVMYELSDLSEGNHSVTIKAWDNYNNSSLESVHFIVHEGGKFILRNLM